MCCNYQMVRIRQEYEMKIKGLMPAELRQELEDTITSLKSQVSSERLSHPSFTSRQAPTLPATTTLRVTKKPRNESFGMKT